MTVFVVATGFILLKIITHSLMRRIKDIIFQNYFV